MSKTILSCFYIFCSLVVFAQDKGTIFSLHEALEYSTEHNFSIKNAKIDIEYSKKEVLDITSVGLPQIKGGFSYNYFLDRPVSLIPGEFLGLPAGEMAEMRFGTDHNAIAELQASQLVLDTKYIVGISASKALLRLIGSIKSPLTS